jgi:hypothetical protein
VIVGGGEPHVHVPSELRDGVTFMLLGCAHARTAAIDPVRALRRPRARVSLGETKCDPSDVALFVNPASRQYTLRFRLLRRARRGCAPRPQPRGD